MSIYPSTPKAQQGNKTSIPLLGILFFLNSPFCAAVEPMSNNQIRDLMIQETVDTHGYCACPYSQDALGGQCGTESAYYLPGAFRVYCFRLDISSEEVHFYRLKHASLRFGQHVEYQEPSKTQTSRDCVAPKEGAARTEDPTAVYFKNNAPTTQQFNPFSPAGPSPGSPNANVSTSAFFGNNAPATSSTSSTSTTTTPSNLNNNPVGFQYPVH